MPGRPTLAEIEATVARMEARLAAESDPQAAPAMAAYRRLLPVFQRDLAADPRDIALARASALMLVQTLTQRSP
jgi:hypothetical protein